MSRSATSAERSGRLQSTRPPLGIEAGTHTLPLDIPLKLGKGGGDAPVRIIYGTGFVGAAANPFSEWAYLD